MQSIGISPFGIAINAVVFLLITVIFDVPSGVLADKWNRKYTLVLAILSLGLSSFILGKHIKGIPKVSTVKNIIERSIDRIDTTSCPLW